jgi:hypothetical protein
VYLVALWFNPFLPGRNHLQDGVGPEATSHFKKVHRLFGDGENRRVFQRSLDIDQIVIPSRTLRIATISMVDPDQDAMRYFFQGSAGAQTTFYMLGATLMQPHLVPPLMDGLVFLYNGEMLPELDHSNVEGILISRLVQGVAKRAI